MAPQNSSRDIPSCPATGADNCRRMSWSPAPGQRIKVEHVGNRRGLHARSELGLAFEKKIIIALRVVLHISISMRRQGRAVGIDCIRVNRARAILARLPGNITV